jgi:hypothetical protein
MSTDPSLADHGAQVRPALIFARVQRAAKYEAGIRMIFPRDLFRKILVGDLP